MWGIFRMQPILCRVLLEQLVRAWWTRVSWQVIHFYFWRVNQVKKFWAEELFIWYIKLIWLRLWRWSAVFPFSFQYFNESYLAIEKLVTVVAVNKVPWSKCGLSAFNQAGDCYFLPWISIFTVSLKLKIMVIFKFFGFKAVFFSAFFTNPPMVGQLPLIFFILCKWWDVFLPT